MKLHIINGLLITVIAAALPCQTMHRAKRIMGHIAPAVVAAQAAAVSVVLQPVSASGTEQEAKIKADVDALINDLTSDVHPLLKAYYENDLEAFKKIVACSVDIKADIAATQDNKVGTILECAITDERWEIIDLLRSKGALVDIHLVADLARQRKPAATIVALITRYRLPINEQDRNGIPLLITAIEIGDETLVKELLKLPAINMNAIGRLYGYTALMVAVDAGKEDIALALLKAGADVNAQSSRGSTALMLAVEHNNKKLLIELLRAGAHVNIQNKYGNTALILATKHNELIIELLKAGADVNLQNDYGKTVLMVAADWKNEYAIRQLLTVPGIKLNMRDQQGQTALMLAAHCLDSASAEVSLLITKHLMQAGANPTLRDNNGETVLMYARRGFMVDYLLTIPGIDLHARDHHGDTAFTHAARMALVLWGGELMKTLLKAGSDVNVKGKDGWTALMHAAFYHEADLVALLLNAGADVTIRCNKGKTALRWAYERYDKNKPECLLVIGMLKEKAARVQGAATQIKSKL